MHEPMKLSHLIANGEVRRVAIEADQFKRSIRGDADEVLANAEGLSFTPAPPVEEPKRRGRKPRGEGASAATEKVNYASLEHAGTPHRGRVTEAEAELVRNNLADINERLEAQGHPKIDPNDDKAKKRYGF